MKKELTIEHLSVYLPHKVKVKINGMIKELVCNTISDSHLNQGLYIGIPNLLGVHGVNGRLLLRPLYQLTETIEHNGERFVPIVRIAEILGMRQVSPYDADDEGVIYYGWDHTSYDSSEQHLFSYYEDGKFGVWQDEVSGVPLYSEFSLEVIQFMHSIHVDLYGLIESGLAEPIPSIPQQ